MPSALAIMAPYRFTGLGVLIHMASMHGSPGYFVQYNKKKNADGTHG